MTNFEFYKDKLLKMMDREFTITKDNTVKYCDDIDCEECLFTEMECEGERWDWLYSEYEKPIRKKPELNEDEKKLLELVKRGCIVRDKDDMLSIIVFYPDWDFDKNFIKKDEQLKCWVHNNGNAPSIHILKSQCSNLKFNFVKWEDDKPWDIELLLSDEETKDEDSKDVKDEEDCEEKNKCAGCEFDDNFKRYGFICNSCKRAYVSINTSYPDLYVKKEESIAKCQSHDECKNKDKTFNICTNCTRNVYYEETKPVGDHFKEKKEETK